MGFTNYYVIWYLELLGGSQLKKTPCMIKRLKKNWGKLLLKRFWWTHEVALSLLASSKILQNSSTRLMSLETKNEEKRWRWWNAGDSEWFWSEVCQKFCKATISTKFQSHPESFCWKWRQGLAKVPWVMLCSRDPSSLLWSWYGIVHKWNITHAEGCLVAEGLWNNWYSR